MRTILCWGLLFLIARCSETPAPTAAGVEVDCTDGVDNDSDSLIDCEDGDCAEVCVESDCSNALDDDSDELIDCADEDCWGAEGCNHARTTVLSGNMTHRKRYSFHNDSHDWDSSPGIFTRRQWTSTIELSSIQGNAAFWSPDSSTWISCDWSFTAGTFQRQAIVSNNIIDSTSFTTEILNRTGLNLTGCPTSTTFFLPQVFEIDDANVLANRDIRYYGMVVDYNYLYYTHYKNDTTSGRVNELLIETTWWTEPLEPGGTHSATWSD